MAPDLLCYELSCQPGKKQVRMLNGAVAACVVLFQTMFAKFALLCTEIIQPLFSFAGRCQHSDLPLNCAIDG